MRVRILFPKDSKRPGKGFREEVYEVPGEVVREMFETYRETRNVDRAIDVVCEYVANEAAKKWCRSMGRPKDEDCIDEYLSKQGERIISQCEITVRRWIYDVAECIKRCGRERKCLESCVKGL
ncbi:MAG: hypothetical protein JHC26_04460 [Thermofilum sp.]|jgi:hypothetical protein|uniref:hypothetical protein n=1 Tax=Thermofilum sp. TaxID=1961369 RepID=UPI00258E8568|nr:hypothetical protein [Thermofilum sp.]MCI4408320.1 hypothetical protein [Thermofilum sp.]